MSGFLKYTVKVFYATLFVSITSCCPYYQEPQQFIEFRILDKTGENVILASTLPAYVIRYYQLGFKADAINPSVDWDRGVFTMAISPNKNYQIDIIDQPFVTLDLSFSKEDEQCGSYDRLSGVNINGIMWDYEAEQVLTLVYNP